MNLESLLVCRDAEVVRVLRPTLEKLSIEVEVSAAARSGAEILSTAKFDAVIIDCDDLQGGVDVLRTLRANASNKTSVSFAILNGRRLSWARTSFFRSPSRPRERCAVSIPP